MVSNVIRSICKSSYEIIVVCPPGDIAHEFRQAGATVVDAPRRVPSLWHVSGVAAPVLSRRFIAESVAGWLYWWRWVRLLRHLDPAMVHLDSVVLAPLVAATSFCKIPCVCLVQETFTGGLFGFRTAVLKAFLNRMTRVVFISEFDRSAAKCHAVSCVIPNWLDTAVFDRTRVQATDRRAKGLPLDNKVVLFLGGVSELKGTHVLLRAFEETAWSKIPLLVIAGYDGWEKRKLGRRGGGWRGKEQQYHESVIKYVEHMKLRENVRFVGMVDDVPAWIAAADVVVFPATAPHQARPIMEAGAMGKPIIASRFECLAGCIVHRVTGLMVEPGDVSGLGAAISEVLNDDALARKMGDEGYRRTIAALNRTRSADAYRNLIAECTT